MKKLQLSILLVLFAFFATAQIGGMGVYQSLKLPPSARVAALGGYQIAVMDNELALGFQNPSLLNPEMHKQMSLSQVNYLADVGFGFAGFGYNLDSNTTVLGGIQYVSYGDFTRTDEFGNTNGSFSGGDYNLVAGIGRKWRHNLSYGANLKIIYSNLEQYYSWGLATDLALTYHRPDRNFTAALVARNLGFQFSSYSSTKEQLPVDLQLGLSQKLENAPFRFNLTFHHLNIPDITFVNPTQQVQVISFNDDDDTDDPNKIALAEKFGRHVSFGTEILLNKHLHFRIGYNHQRRKEMLLPASNTFSNNKGAVGYSWGFGLRVWKLHVDYGRVAHHIGGAANYFTITSNLSQFKKQEKAG
ncbi:MAG: type IX secretion system protein PorQ [Bacteroidetes bacterium]|nr:type IX secretion system protein PorQ [Bacteroidota bacterium]